MPTGQTIRPMIDWRKMGVKYEDFFPHLMGAKAFRRADRMYRHAQEKALRSYSKSGMRVPFLGYD